MTDETLPHAGSAEQDHVHVSADAEPRLGGTAGGRAVRALLWAVAAALLLLVGALAWAVTIAGGGWYLLGAAVFFCVPLPAWYLVSGRRRPGR